MAEEICLLCAYRCSSKIDLIKHLFGAHSVEATFRFKCGINGCSYQFRSGATFASFKTHANRKHPNWQDNVDSCYQGK